MIPPSKNAIISLIPKEIPDLYVAAMVLNTAPAPMIVATLENVSSRSPDDLLLRKYSWRDSFLEKNRAIQNMIIT